MTDQRQDRTSASAAKRRAALEEAEREQRDPFSTWMHALVQALTDEYVQGEQQMRVLIPMLDLMAEQGWDLEAVREEFATLWGVWVDEAFRRVVLDRAERL